jgi:hypothetical protein
MMRQDGLAVSIISRDEFEETVALGFYMITRNHETILGTKYDVAGSKTGPEILITSNPPAWDKPPEDPPKEIKPGPAWFNPMRNGLAKPNRKYSIANYTAARIRRDPSQSSPSIRCGWHARK